MDPLRLSCEVRRVTLREYRVPSGHYVRDDIVEYQDPQTGYVERFIVTVFFLRSLHDIRYRVSRLVAFFEISLIFESNYD